MTKKEFTMFVMAMRTYFPREDILPNDEAMALWFRELEDIPFDVMETVLRRWVGTNKWSPSIAELRELAVEVVDGPLPDWGAGWEQVQKAFLRYGTYEAQKAYDSFDPITRRVVKSLNWYQLCMSTQANNDRANFRDLFNEYARRERLERQNPAVVREKMAALRGTATGAPALGNGAPPVDLTQNTAQATRSSRSSPSSPCG